MWKKCLTLYRKYEEIINYLIVGVLTTVVSLVIYYGSVLTFLDPDNGLQLQIANVLSWIGAVAFAYVTNKLFVFESKSWKLDIVKKEIPSFLSARIASYFIEQAGLWFFVDILSFDEKVFDFLIVKLSGKITAKLIIGVVVVVINYVLSKFMIFAKKESSFEKSGENE